MVGNFMSKLYSLFSQNVVLPFYDLVRHTSRFRYSRVLDKTQWLSRAELEQLQCYNLRKLLAYAYNYVPYYHRVFKERNLFPSDIKAVEDLVKLPVLTKADIRMHKQDLVSTLYTDRDLVPFRSGGSSGDQVRFFVTNDQLSWEIAAEFRAYGWAGYSLGDYCFMFWASPIDLSKSKGFQKGLTKKLERVFIANTYIMSDKVLANFASLLLSKRPEIVRGYASSVYLMAKYLVDHRIESVRPRAVITTAETLFPSMRQMIEEAFGCEVFDFYGSREIGGMASECEHHSGYHISVENVAIEFIQDEEQVAAGEKGVMFLTSLRNYGMPLIRYKVGDVGEPRDDVCECGRGLPLVSSLSGRMSDFMAVYDQALGRVMPVGPIYPLIIYGLMHVPLKGVRVFQNELNRLEVKAVKDSGYTKKHSDYLIAFFKDALGENIQIDIDFLDSIPPLPSGKRSVFVSKINPFETSAEHQSV
jgi:phenylacetate-CoA ligase